MTDTATEAATNDMTNRDTTERRKKTALDAHENNVHNLSTFSLDKKIRIDAIIFLVLISGVLFGLRSTITHPAEYIALFIVAVALTALLTYRRLQDQKAFHAVLLESAQIDPLTRINNYLGLEGALAREISRMKRHKVPFSILMIDIDDFSLINGLYGYKTGDQLLQHIARMLGMAVRITDSIGRYSGEEFLVILANTEGRDAVLVGERIRKTLLEKPVQLGTETIHASISVGVAECSYDFDSIDKLVSHADDALKTAKATGKNRVCGWQMA